MALTCIQLVSLAFMGVGAMVLMAGVASPVWERHTFELKEKPDETDPEYLHVGLFYACQKKVGYDVFDNCKPFEWDLSEKVLTDGEDLFFKVVRVLMCQAVFFTLIGNIAGIVFACNREDRDCIAVPGLLNTFGAMGGIAGVVTYAMWSKSGMINPFHGTDGIDVSDVEGIRGWSFYMSAAASGFILLVSIIGMGATSYKGSYVLGNGCVEGQRSPMSNIYTIFDKNAAKLNS